MKDSGIFAEHDSHFECVNGIWVDTRVLGNPSISFKAKGIYIAFCTLQQKHGIENPTFEDLLKFAKDGRDSTQSGINELRSAGIIPKPKTPKPTGPGFIYLVFNPASEWHKIGLSKDVKTRVKALRNAMACDIVLIHSFPVANMGRAEDELHERFSGKRKTGEWFDLNESDLAYIKSIGGES